MNPLRAVPILLLACALAPAFAQELPLEPPPASRTGDPWVDHRLDDINVYGARYRDAFVDELVRYHNAPRALVLDLLERKWPPGDIYYACALGAAAGRPCRQVVDQYADGEGPDWHVVAQRIGVQIESVQYRRLKQGLVAAYGRWGRPIEAEAAGRGPAAQGGPVGRAAAPAKAATIELPVGSPGEPPGAAAKQPPLPKPRKSSASARGD
jgi:hypothetical protein